VVLDNDHVLVVLGRREAEIAVRATTVVVAANAGAADSINVEH
jgi:hypothetical protein